MIVTPISSMMSPLYLVGTTLMKYWNSPVVPVSSVTYLLTPFKLLSPLTPALVTSLLTPSPISTYSASMKLRSCTMWLALKLTLSSGRKLCT